MLDEWDLRHQAFHTAMWRAVVLTICCKCVNGCLIWSALSIYLAAANSAFGGNAGSKHDQHQTLTAAVLARDTARAVS